MSSAELKIDLIKKITELNNPSLVEKMQRLIDSDSDKEDGKLTAAQKIE